MAELAVFVIVALILALYGVWMLIRGIFGFFWDKHAEANRSREADLRALRPPPPPPTPEENLALINRYASMRPAPGPGRWVPMIQQAMDESDDDDSDDESDDDDTAEEYAMVWVADAEEVESEDDEDSEYQAEADAYWAQQQEEDDYNDALRDLYHDDD